VIDAAVTGIRAGRPVILPTDTVYGLCTTADAEEAVERLYALKGRPSGRPTALLASDVDMLLECVPELRGRAAVLARALLPGPFTLVLPNPARRYRWLAGGTPDKIGVRVPELPALAAAVLAQVGAVAATSANLSGGPDPCRLDDVPDELRQAAAAELDAGELPGVPSTVIDLTGAEPKVLREGAVPAAEAIERAAAAAA
jgi:L-threonylcarbamoyladenylate synthase